MAKNRAGNYDVIGKGLLDTLEVSGATVLQGTVAVSGAFTAEDSIVSDGDLQGAGLQLASGVVERVADVTISAADIVATTAGKFGHAAGYPLVADPGADFLLELVSALMVNDRATAAYTAGGNITVNRNGGSAITGLVSAANSLGAATDTISLFVPLAAAAEVAVANKGLNLVTSAAFTNPGTAAGVVRVRVRYRVHTLGLV
jgi:hypothetical protein